MKKILKNVGIILLIVVFSVFSPTIISEITELVKKLNTNITIKVTNGEWLAFYAAIFGGLITLLVFLISNSISKKQLEIQHKENINSINYQTNMTKLKDIKDKISDLLEAYTRNDKFRLANNLLIEKKYSDAYSIIEEMRNKCKLTKNNVYIYTDLKKIINFEKCNKCNIISQCKEMEKLKNEINSLIIELDNIYIPVLDKFQDYIVLLQKQREFENVENMLNTKKKTLVQLIKALEEKDIITTEDELEITKCNEEIKNVEVQLNEIIKNKSISEKINEELNQYNDLMNRYNKDMPAKIQSLMEKAKAYIELKNNIYLEKLNDSI
jgi:hypothetical protein